MPKFVPKEVVKQAKEIDLLTYFMNNNPSELVRKGTNTYSLKSHDSVIISNGLWHRFSTHQAGKSAVDYLIKVENMSLQEAVSSVLNRNIDTYIRPQYSNENAPKTIVIPEKASTNKQVIEYLKNRGIDEEIINDCINKKIIYQENKTNNAVFLGYDNDNNIKYAGCRSTNEKRIMRDAKGSSKEYSFRMLGAEECNSLHIIDKYVLECKECNNQNDKPYVIDVDKLKICIFRSIKYHIDLLNGFENARLSVKENKEYADKIKENVENLKNKLERLDKERTKYFTKFRDMEIDEQEYIAFIRENVKEEENIKEQIKKEKAKLMEARLSYKNVAENNWVDTLMKYKNQRKITKEMLNDLIEKIYINNDGRKIKLVFKYEDAFKLAMDYLKIVKEGGNTNA